MNIPPLTEMGARCRQENQGAACNVWLDKPFFLLGGRSFVTIITGCLRQVDRHVGGKHENLEDCSLVISD